jgi:HEAT repeat protein
MTEAAAPARQNDGVRIVEELFRMLSKAQRALQMYLPNNPVYLRAMQQATEAFAPVWGFTQQLTLEVQEDRLNWDGDPVFQQPAKAEGLAWQLYKDGLRELTLLPGVESEEIFRFLSVVNRARMLPADAADDLLTLMWEQEFQRITYLFVEISGDGVEFSLERGGAEPGRGGGGGGPGGIGGAGGGTGARAEVAAGAAAPAGSEHGRGGGHGVVDLADFDATLYFLEESEIRYVQSELEDEYRRDIRQAAIDALLDTLEAQRDPGVRQEVIALLEEILPAQLATGGFQAVARILRELRGIGARAAGQDESLHQAVQSFEEELSTPEMLEQLFRVLSDNSERPAEEDVGEVLRELRATALPAILAHLGRIVDPNVRRNLELSVDAIARSQPEMLAAIVSTGADDTIIPAIALAARLGLTPVVPAIVEHLAAGDQPRRVAAVRALGELGTPSAIGAVEAALKDPDRSVRQIALGALLQRGGSGGMLKQLEPMLFDGAEPDWERSERRAMFEAYGTLAGAPGIARLRELLEPRGVFRRKESPDVRASALFALAKVHTDEARRVIETFAADKEPVVRSAANAALREWST